MRVDINGVNLAIRNAGSINTRITPMADKSADGLYMIEVREGSEWRPILTDVKRNIAESIVASSVNKVLLG